MKMETIAERLSRKLAAHSFGHPVAYAYDPLDYAWNPFRTYLRRYGTRPKRAVLVGMNPGPWGMAQTGIPFGDVQMVRDWLGIEGRVGRPGRLHPKRPVEGFACERRERSGQRLWGWARSRFRAPEAFFKLFMVVNYCPLVFFDTRGANITPDRLRATDRRALFAACDEALRDTLAYYAPRFAVGIGRLAHGRIAHVIRETGGHTAVGYMDHPSPANPRAHRGWERRVERELSAMGALA